MKVLTEDAYRWSIECAGAGCSNVVNVPKRVGHPAADAVRPDGTIDPAKVTWTDEPKPTVAPRCILHPQCAVCDQESVSDWIVRDLTDEIGWTQFLRSVPERRAQIDRWHLSGHQGSLEEFDYEELVARHE